MENAVFTNKEYIYAVYKERSFSKAAEKLYISQPSLSLTIKKIEKRIGAQIFDRSTSPIQLTECGEEYIRCIERMVDLETGFLAYLHDLHDLKVGRLAIGASNFFASYILPPIITKFKTKFPSISVNLIESDTAHLEKQLHAGELDLIIDNYAFDETIYQKNFFYEEDLILAVPASLPHNKYLQKYRLNADDIIQNKHKDPAFPGVPLKRFLDAPFVLLRFGNDTRDRADLILAEHSVKPDIVLELDQLATAYHVACHDMGITFISDTLIREVTYDTRMVYYKIDSPNISRKNYFYYKKNKYLTRPMQEFLEVLSEPSAFN